MTQKTSEKENELKGAVMTTRIKGGKRHSLRPSGHKAVVAFDCTTVYM